MTNVTQLRRVLAAEPSERLARELGWNRDSHLTWREFLEQYPYPVPGARITPRAA